MDAKYRDMGQSLQGRIYGVPERLEGCKARDSTPVMYLQVESALQTALSLHA
jgi:hypothetical protein